MQRTLTTVLALALFAQIAEAAPVPEPPPPERIRNDSDAIDRWYDYSWILRKQLPLARQLAFADMETLKVVDGPVGQVRVKETHVSADYIMEYPVRGFMFAIETVCETISQSDDACYLRLRYAGELEDFEEFLFIDERFDDARLVEWLNQQGRTDLPDWPFGGDAATEVGLDNGIAGYQSKMVRTLINGAECNTLAERSEDFVLELEDAMKRQEAEREARVLREGRPTPPRLHAAVITLNLPDAEGKLVAGRGSYSDEPPYLVVREFLNTLEPCFER